MESHLKIVEAGGLGKGRCFLSAGLLADSGHEAKRGHDALAVSEMNRERRYGVGWHLDFWILCLVRIWAIVQHQYCSTVERVGLRVVDRRNQSLRDFVRWLET